MSIGSNKATLSLSMLLFTEFNYLDHKLHDLVLFKFNSTLPAMMQITIHGPKTNLW